MQIERLESIFAIKRLRSLIHLTRLELVIITVLVIVNTVAAIPFLDPTNYWLFWMWDDSSFINVANNLREGNGFTSTMLDYNEIGVRIGKNEWIDFKYDLYSAIDHPYRTGGPLYPLVLGSALLISNANYNNWQLVGNLLSLTFSNITVAIYYLLIRKNYSFGIACASALIIVLLSSLTWYSARVIPLSLFYMLMLLALYYVTKATSKKNSIILGAVVALSHLTHPIGMLLLISIMIWKIARKEIRYAIAVFLTYALVMSPWLIRNYIVLGDPTQGTGLPFALIMQIFGVDIGSSLNLAVPSHYTLDPRIIFENIWIDINETYNMGIILVFLAFSIAIFSKFDRKSLASLNGFCAIFSILSVLAVVYIGYVTSRNETETKYLMHIFFLLIPISILGVHKIMDFLSKTLVIHGQLLLFGRAVRRKTAMNGIILAVLIPLLVTSLITFENHRIEENKKLSENIYAKEAHHWLRQFNNINILSDKPHATFMKTGHPSVLILLQFDQFRSNEFIKKLVDKYDIDYVVLYQKKDWYERSHYLELVYANPEVKIYLPKR